MNKLSFEQVLAALQSDLTSSVADHFSAQSLDYMQQAISGEGRVWKFKPPSEAAQVFAETLPSGIQPTEAIFDRLASDVIPDATRLCHPKYVGVNVAPPLPISVWSETLIAAMNQSHRVYAMSPSTTPIEVQMVRWLNSLVGYEASAGGSFTSGGTESNFTAMLAARQRAMPDAWQNGMGKDPPVIVCAENVHYSITRAAAQLGLGIDRVIRLPLRDNKMDTDALASCLATMNHEKRQVMAVVATVGCSGTGAFDDIDTIGQLCETHDVWLHVDGAHGATALLSQAHKHRLKGLERAQSVTWDLHKMLLMPLPASVLLVRDQADLLHAFYPEAKADKQYWNLGKYSFMASRRADALKVWVAFQRYGADGLGAIYEYLCHLAQVTCALVRARPDFELAHEPDCNVVCFRYIGTPSKRAPDEIAQINQAIHDRIDHFGESMIARAFIDDLVVLRTTYMNPFTKEHHVAEILDEIAKVGRDLERESSPSV